MTTTLTPHHQPATGIYPTPLPESFEPPAAPAAVPSVIAPAVPGGNMLALTGRPDESRPIRPMMDQQAIVRLCLRVLAEESARGVEFTPMQTAAFLKAALLVYQEGKDAGLAEALTAM